MKRDYWNKEQERLFQNSWKPACDSLDKLRKSDVYRVLENANALDILGYATGALIEARPDLESEVKEVRDELWVDIIPTDTPGIAL